MLFHYSMVTVSKNRHRLILKPQFLHFDSFHRPPFYTIQWIKVHLAMILFFWKYFFFLFTSSREVPVKINVYRWRSNQLRKVAKLITAPLFRQIATMDNYCLQNLRHKAGNEKPWKIFLLWIFKSMDSLGIQKHYISKVFVELSVEVWIFFILKFKFSIF